MTKRIQTISNIPQKKETILIPMKVLEPYSPSVTEFGSVHEFQEYLTQHKTEMDAMTTQKLNKTFRIVENDTDGQKRYVITKLGGEISLKLSHSPPTTVPQDSTIHQRVELLEQQIAAIITVLKNSDLIPGGHPD